MTYTYSKRTRNGKTTVTAKCSDATYQQLVNALQQKYPGVIITSGGSYTSVSGRI